MATLLLPHTHHQVNQGAHEEVSFSRTGSFKPQQDVIVSTSFYWGICFTCVFANSSLEHFPYIREITTYSSKYCCKDPDSSRIWTLGALCSGSYVATPSFSVVFLQKRLPSLFPTYSALGNNVTSPTNLVHIFGLRVETGVPVVKPTHGYKANMKRLRPVLTTMPWPIYSFLAFFLDFHSTS